MILSFFGGIGAVRIYTLQNYAGTEQALANVIISTATVIVTA